MPRSGGSPRNVPSTGDEHLLCKSLMDPSTPQLKMLGETLSFSPWSNIPQCPCVNCTLLSMKAVVAFIVAFIVASGSIPGTCSKHPWGPDTTRPCWLPRWLPAPAPALRVWCFPRGLHAAPVGDGEVPGSSALPRAHPLGLQSTSPCMRRPRELWGQCGGGEACGTLQGKAGDEHGHRRGGQKSILDSARRAGLLWGHCRAPGKGEAEGGLVLLVCAVLGPLQWWHSDLVGGGCHSRVVGASKVPFSVYSPRSLVQHPASTRWSGGDSVLVLQHSVVRGRLTGVVTPGSCGGEAGEAAGLLSTQGDVLPSVKSSAGCQGGRLHVGRCPGSQPGPGGAGDLAKELLHSPRLPVHAPQG